MSICKLSICKHRQEMGYVDLGMSALTLRMDKWSKRKISHEDLNHYPGQSTSQNISRSDSNYQSKYIYRQTSLNILPSTIADMFLRRTINYGQ